MNKLFTLLVHNYMFTNYLLTVNLVESLLIKLETISLLSKAEKNTISKILFQLLVSILNRIIPHQTFQLQLLTLLQVFQSYNKHKKFLIHNAQENILMSELNVQWSHIKLESMF